MSTRSMSRSALLLALIAPATAQDSTAPPQTKVSQGPGLIVKTTEYIFVANMSYAEVSRLGEGQHYILTIDGPGKTTVTTADGKASFLEMTAKPARLMELFAEDGKSSAGLSIKLRAK